MFNNTPQSPPQGTGQMSTTPTQSITHERDSTPATSAQHPQNPPAPIQFTNPDILWRNQLVQRSLSASVAGGLNSVQGNPNSQQVPANDAAAPVMGYNPYILNYPQPVAHQHLPENLDGQYPVDFDAPIYQEAAHGHHQYGNPFLDPGEDAQVPEQGGYYPQYAENNLQYYPAAVEERLELEPAHYGAYDAAYPNPQQAVYSGDHEGAIPQQRNPFQAQTAANPTPQNARANIIDVDNGNNAIELPKYEGARDRAATPLPDYTIIDEQAFNIANDEAQAAANPHGVEALYANAPFEEHVRLQDSRTNVTQQGRRVPDPLAPAGGPQRTPLTLAPYNPNNSNNNTRNTNNQNSNSNSNNNNDNNNHNASNNNNGNHNNLHNNNSENGNFVRGIGGANGDNIILLDAPETGDNVPPMAARSTSRVGNTTFTLYTSVDDANRTTPSPGMMDFVRQIHDTLAVANGLPPSDPNRPPRALNDWTPVVSGNAIFPNATHPPGLEAPTAGDNSDDKHLANNPGARQFRNFNPAFIAVYLSLIPSFMIIPPAMIIYKTHSDSPYSHHDFWIRIVIYVAVFGGALLNFLLALMSFRYIPRGNRNAVARMEYLAWLKSQSPLRVMMTRCGLVLGVVLMFYFLVICYTAACVFIGRNLWGRAYL